jgi:GAF domain-containing protein
MDALPPDTEFLRVTGTAARLLRAPGAFVAVGVDGAESFACVPEVHRAEITALAVRCLADDTSRAWTVEDVAEDTRTAGVVGSAPIRALAVQPLVAADGRTVGVLGVIDAVARRFTDEELMTLADLGHLVAHEFDLRQAVRRAIFAR